MKGQIYRWLASFLPLLALIFLAAWFYWPRPAKKANQLPPPPPISSLQAIVLQRGKTKLRLERQKNGWWWADKSASVAAIQVQDFLTALAKIKAAELVSRRREREAQFGVASQAAKIRLEGKQGSWQLLVGKTAWQRRGTFIRRPGDERTYLLPVFLRDFFSRANW